MNDLSGVQPERQKIMLKGKTLGNESWDSFPIKNGVLLMMIGSADALPTAPQKKTVFVEDMTEAQLAQALEMSTGLKNLGNTCYMNATLQCLKTIPELREGLNEYRTNRIQPTSADMITAAVRDLFASMDRCGGRQQQEVIPLIMLQVLHTVWPHFATKDEHGHLQQQDANEFWVEAVRMFQQKLPGKSVVADPSPSSTGSEGDVAAASVSGSRLINQFFRGEISVEMKCTESEEGLALVEEITKHSLTLDRDAKYEKRSLLRRLPAYLTIQMMRFYYKEKEQVNAKILKDVKFPHSLDVFDLCDPELQQKLMPMRDKFKKEDDRIAEAAAGKADSVQNGTVSSGAGTEGKNLVQPVSFADDPGSNNSGFYELQAVLTHKGIILKSHDVLSHVGGLVRDGVKGGRR